MNREDIRKNVQEKGHVLTEVWCNAWRRLYKTDNFVMQHILEKFPCRRLLAEHQYLGEIRIKKWFCFVECEIEFFHFLKLHFVKFLSMLKTHQSIATKIECWWNGIQRKLADDSTSQSDNFTLHSTKRKALQACAVIPSSTGPSLYNSLLLWWVHPKISFRSLVQSLLGTRRPIVFAERLKLLASDSYGYQVLKATHLE